MVCTFGSSYNKMIFTLLADVITFHVLYVQESSLPKSFSRAFQERSDNSKSMSFQNHLENPLEIIFRIFWHQKKNCRSTWGSGRSWKSRGLRRENRLLETQERSGEIVHFLKAVIIFGSGTMRGSYGSCVFAGTFLTQYESY